MNTELVVFDLDGTLVSSHETIYKATLKALEAVDVRVPIPEEEFNGMIGLHFEDIFSRLGFQVPDFDEFLTIYKSIYFDYIGNSYLYSGVAETLGILRNRKIKTALLTTKSQDHTEVILKHFSIYGGFDYVMGRRPGIPHKPSPEPLLIICRETGAPAGKTIMTGDSELDIICGREAGARTCAVTYGYRKRPDLEKENPDFIIDNIMEIAHIACVD